MKKFLILFCLFSITLASSLLITNYLEKDTFLSNIAYATPEMYGYSLHRHEFEYTKLDNAKHIRKCKYCDFRDTPSHAYREDGTCVCGATKNTTTTTTPSTGATSNCNHKYTYTQVSSIKHIGVCKFCGKKTGQINHEFEYVLSSSSNKEEDKNNRHIGICKSCGYSTGNLGHEYNEGQAQGPYRCKDCSLLLVCKNKSHSYKYTVNSNDNNTHIGKCIYCNTKTDPINHRYNPNGTLACPDCGLEIKCVNHNMNWKRNKKQHSGKCLTCNQEIKGQHEFIWDCPTGSDKHYYKCSICDYFSESGNHKYNKDGSGTCSICKVPLVTCSTHKDNNKDNICDICYKKTAFLSGELLNNIGTSNYSVAVPMVDIINNKSYNMSNYDLLGWYYLLGTEFGNASPEEILRGLELYLQRPGFTGNVASLIGNGITYNPYNYRKNINSYPNVWRAIEMKLNQTEESQEIAQVMAKKTSYAGYSDLIFDNGYVEALLSYYNKPGYEDTIFISDENIYNYINYQTGSNNTPPVTTWIYSDIYPYECPYCGKTPALNKKTGGYSYNKNGNYIYVPHFIDYYGRCTRCNSYFSQYDRSK
ncbi:MAG: hypothetical protein IJS47_02730 [Clostridia bacterium]|nr:hypothetical protein [Clostridia bacterium]